MLVCECGKWKFENNSIAPSDYKFVKRKGDCVIYSKEDSGIFEAERIITRVVCPFCHTEVKKRDS